MALKNKSMYAILGILNLSPSTGYDIKKYSDQVLGGFWNENFGHIYPTLKRMSEDGLIEVMENEECDKRVLYGITSKGQEELDTWLKEETLPQPIRSEFMLKLFFSSNQPREQVTQKLEAYRILQQHKLDKYHELLNDLEKGISELTSERVEFYKIVLRRAVLSSEADIRWCEETANILCSI